MYVQQAHHCLRAVTEILCYNPYFVLEHDNLFCIILLKLVKVHMYVQLFTAVLNTKTVNKLFFCSGSEGNISFEQVINHLEQSCRHLESLADPLIYELTEHDEVCCILILKL